MAPPASLTRTVQIYERFQSFHQVPPDLSDILPDKMSSVCVYIIHLSLLLYDATAIRGIH